MTLTLTPHRRREPRRIRGIPTISARHLDGGTANVSAVDTELPTGSTPRGLARSWWPGRAPSSEVLTMTASAAGPCTPACTGLTSAGSVSTSPGRLYPRVRGADSGAKGVERGGVPSTPAYARLTLWRSRSPSSWRLYPRVRGADVKSKPCTALALPLPPHTRG